MLIYGINAVTEALKRSVRLASRGPSQGSAAAAAASCRRGERPFRRGPSDESLIANPAVRRIKGSSPMSRARMYVSTTIEEAPTKPPPLIVLLSGLEDPHNFGAILRTCDARRSRGRPADAPFGALGGATSKASAGAVAHVKIADVVKLRVRLRTSRKRASGPWGSRETRRVRTIKWIFRFRRQSCWVRKALGFGA